MKRKFPLGRKVRTAEHMVSTERWRLRLRRTVRATVTNRVAPSETTKLLGIPMKIGRVILPAATADFHHNGDVPYLGDNAAGTREIIV